LNGYKQLVAKAKDLSKTQTEEETAIASTQIAAKVDELQSALSRCAVELDKEDRLTSIMNSIIATI
jgi:hypothetical protein